MPFELNIRAAPIDPTHQNLENRRGEMYERGNIISVKPYGWSSHPTWSQSKYPYANNGGLFCTIVCPDGPTPEEIKNALWMDEWKDNLLFEILNVNEAQGRYTIKVTNTTVSVSGKNALMRNRIESFLLEWGCTSISFSSNAVQFMISLWNAVRSVGFWDVNLIGTYVTFTLISYDGGSGEGRIKVTITNQVVTPNKVIERIEERGGVIVMISHPDYTFNIAREVIRKAFIADVKQRVEGIYFRRRRFVLSQSLIDQIIIAGGRMQVSYATLLSSISDGFNE